MKILITGNKGFIGTNLVNYLKDRYEIIGLDRKNDNELLTCDLPDVDIVIHLAAMSGVRDSMDRPTEYWKNNVIVSQRIFDRYKDKRILYASSSTAKEPWMNPYAMSKYSMEQIAPAGSLGMRFTTVYGPGAREQMLIPKILKNDVPYINTNHSRDFIHVDDICSAIFSLLTHNDITAFPNATGVIDVGTGITHKLTDIIAHFGITAKESIGGDNERLDNKADMKILTGHGWEPQHELMKYIKKNRVVN
jgi:nucleoside-diphosphate-sugar epimerase